ncbi:beta-hydroxyacyl-ACP dehydratase [Candidatus Woesearchaeota archaeon]|nr:beta-hydroxyacyl-ACP dehydratase [Candidatus Woesearchaeota archaeon]
MIPMDEIEKLKKDGQLDKEAIMKIIPYNEHFLMIDKVTELEKKKIVATKEITGDEDYLKGHFAGFPIMPGALMVEGMGQAATLLMRYNVENHQEKEILAYKIKDAKFSKPTFPPAVLTYEAEMQGMDNRGALLTSKAMVDGQKVAEATLMLAMVDRKQFRSQS